MVSVNIQVSNITLSSENRLKLLETYIGNRFNFEFHTVKFEKKLSKNYMLWKGFFGT